MSGPTKPTVVDRPGSDADADSASSVTHAERPNARIGDPDASATRVERPSARSNERDEVETHASAGRNATQGDRPASRLSRPPPVGERYAPGEEIARGGMGRVALATDRRLDRVVALKQALTEDPETLRRFARETKITARLEHPSIVPVYDAGEQDGSPFYVMRRVSGRPLSDLIDGAPTLGERLAILPHVLAAAQAVAHAHRRGIVHRDIKPANILVGDLGETVVIDWGLAKVVGEPDDEDPVEAAPAGDSLRTRAGTVFGTPGFMSRSQLKGESAGPQADVYALGATLYYVLSGKPPHHARNTAAMMELAEKGPPTPIAELVPGVPRELATIIDMALAFGESTYPDAAAFAEDLRRFSTGQLVASHRYSTGERLRRFVRRHRAAVASAVAALVVIAIVGFVSIRSVLVERDDANESRKTAEAAQSRERERADQLLLLRARMLVDSNPTEAIAVLKDLEPHSPRIAEAHAIANAAMMRGVAWALPHPAEPTPFAKMDTKGERLAAITMKGDLVVWDLERRKKLLERRFDPHVRVVWVGKRILIHGSEATAWLDPATGAVEPTAFPRFDDVVVSGNGNTIAGVIADVGELVLLDSATSTTKPLWPGNRATRVVVPWDGSWVGAGNDTDVAAIALDGSVLASRKGELSIIAASRSNHLAVLDNGQPFQVGVKQKSAAWEAIDTLKFHRIVINFSYRDEDLLMTTGSGHFLVWQGGRLVEAGRPENGLMFMSEIGEHGMVLLSGARELLYFDGFGTRTITLPAPLPVARMSANRGRRRVAVTAPGAILVWDLEPATSVRLAAPINSYAEFVDDDTVLLGDSGLTKMSWIDLATGREQPIDTIRAIGLFRLADRHPATGRALISVFSGPTSKLAIATKGRREIAIVYDGPQIVAARLSSTGVLYSAGTKVYFTTGDKPRELVDLGAELDSMAVLDDTRFSALSTTGLWVRGTLTGGEVERTQLPEGKRTTLRVLMKTLPEPLAPDHRGRPLAAWGGSIYRWSDRADRADHLVTLENQIISLGTLGPQLFATTAVGAVLVDPVTRSVHTVPSYAGPLIVNTEHTSALFEIANRFHVFDPVSRTAWPTPIPRLADVPSWSPSGRRAVSKFGVWLYAWELPQGNGDLRERLDKLTNARESKDNVLVWPF